MRRPLTLTTRLLAIGSGFLAVALLSIAFTLWITWKLEGGAAAVNEAGRLRMTMMRMALAGRAEGPEALAPLSVRFDARLDLLRQGDPARPLFVPWNEDTRARFARIVEDWGRLRDGRAAPDVARADAFAARVDGFVEAIERQMARWTAALHLFQMAMMAVAIAAAVAFMAVSHWLVLAPVARLQQALARIRQGDLRTRLPVESQDEFGQLATGFNLMAHALQSSHEDLERKVAEKTSRLEERNARLAALYEVSAQVSEAGSLDTLARGFVRRVREIARADAAAMRWSDEANERYMLLAGDGLPGNPGAGRALPAHRPLSLRPAGGRLAPAHHSDASRCAGRHAALRRGRLPGPGAGAGAHAAARAGRGGPVLPLGDRDRARHAGNAGGHGEPSRDGDGGAAGHRARPGRPPWRRSAPSSRGSCTIPSRSRWPS